MKHNAQRGHINIGFREYSVLCADCEQFLVDYHDTQALFVSSARELGWRVRIGLWRCPQHTARAIARCAVAEQEDETK